MKRTGLRFTTWSLQLKALFRACYTGLAEMVTQLSLATTTWLFNLILMEMTGPDGVAAITVMLYAQFIFSALYIGFSIGIAPIFGFLLGASNKKEILRLEKICARFVWVSSVGVIFVSYAGAHFIVTGFFPAGTSVHALALSGFFIFSLSYLFCGYNIYTAGLFTALSDGKRSATISLLRTFLFITIALLTLPKIWGLLGVWLAVPIAEFVTVGISFVFIQKLRHRLSMI